MHSYELPLGQREVTVSVDLSDRDAEALGLKARTPSNKARTPENKAETPAPASETPARRPGHKPRGGK